MLLPFSAIVGPLRDWLAPFLTMSSQKQFLVEKGKRDFSFLPMDFYENR